MIILPRLAPGGAAVVCHDALRPGLLKEVPPWA